MAVFPNGQGSYVGVAQQAGPTGWGGSLVATGLKTFPNLSGSDIINAQQGKAPRRSFAGVMPRISQTYPTLSLVQVSWQTEFVTDPTSWQPVLTAVFGKRTHSGATSPYTDTYTATNPLFDSHADDTPANPYSVYNHSLSLHAFISDGTNTAAKYSVKDVILTNFTWAGRANEATTVGFQGTGRTMAASASTVAFTDQAGSIMSWDKAIAGANSGIYVDTSSPPTTAMPCRSFTFTWQYPHDFHAALGAASGAEMRTPVRSGSPTAKIAFEMDFEDAASGADATTIATDFIAGTNEGVLITYYSGTTDSIALRAHGTVDPVSINNPRIAWGTGGPVTFAWDADLYPDANTDLAMILTTSSST